MSRDEALTAVLNAARAWRHSRGHTFEPQAAAALCAAIDAVDAVGDATTALYFCAAAECWRQNDTAGMYCHQHSPAAALPQVRRRDAVFEGGEDG